MGQGRLRWNRLGAGALVLLLHVIALLWLVTGTRAVRRESVPEPQFVSLWAEERPLPARVVPTPAALPPTRLPARTEQPTVELAAPEQPRGTAIDWQGEASAVAKDHVATGQSAAFGKPLPGQHKPCKVKEWKWSPQPKKAGLLPLPFVVIGRCVVGLGFFGCSVGAPAEVDTDQLDDYRRGEGAGPSVPDPEQCD